MPTFDEAVKKRAGSDEALGVPGGDVGGIPVVTPDDLGPAAAMTPAEVVTDEDAQAALSASFVTGTKVDEPVAGYGPNITFGDPTNEIADDVGSALISGGGQTGYNNVIGGDGSSTVGTSTPNATSAGTGAHYSAIFGGYDCVVGGLASIIGGFHNYTAIGTTHGTILGGSTNKITAGDYGVIGGGRSNTLSGTDAVICGGEGNTASGNQSLVAGGNDNTASATAAAVLGGLNNVASVLCATVLGGRDNTAGNQYATASGRDANARIVGERAHASGKFATVGDAQISDFVVRKQTTNATPANLAVDGGSTLPFMVADSTWAVDALVVARRTDANDESAAYQLRFCVDRNVNTVALVGTVDKTVIGEDNAAWDVDVVISGSSVSIVVTGEAAKTIHWVAQLRCVQVIG